ncbi:monovalent cation/H(+) antiporter subunit G [Dethiobacter alkaliphilus]|uniref:monovalent cation/H(+) antiporter subunit G n=1 Tax=Dethiobacter alkaliphilus TaxID=427926 RepID=UPI0022275D8C|nr:monovalent cation/H(+) antiporter subunit G [Dethiobacter alkaliphilus]MCW3489172.1 monovalent cation/H(+) antiporter subunit G [Dethiobacter alkaliphilus]
MTVLYELVVSFLLWAGLFFLFVGTVGLIRLPDLYTRMHATSKCDTLGVGLILLAMMTQMSGYNAMIKLAIIWAFIWSINPLVAHIIGYVAYLRDEEHVPETFFIDCYDSPYPGKEMAGKEDVHA